jgi:hypothetical protein
MIQREILGVPHYMQGGADGLCVYYAMSMLLGAILPEYRLAFNYSLKKFLKDPVFKELEYRANNKTDFKKQVADWFFHGMRVYHAERLLNNIFRQKFGPKSNARRKYWQTEEVRAHKDHKTPRARKGSKVSTPALPSVVQSTIDRHIPVLVAHGGLGPHAAIIIGYKTARNKGVAKEFLLCDPGEPRLTWWPSGVLFTGDAQAILPLKRWLDPLFDSPRSLVKFPLLETSYNLVTKKSEAKLVLD